jgi:hypothetical protein
MTKWQDEHGIPVDDAGRYDAALIDWELLDEIPTIHDSYTADLKVETRDGDGLAVQRVWLERTTTADGEHCDHHITVETYDGNRWVTTSEN